MDLIFTLIYINYPSNVTSKFLKFKVIFRETNIKRQMYVYKTQYIDSYYKIVS